MTYIPTSRELDTLGALFFDLAGFAGVDVSMRLDHDRKPPLQLQVSKLAVTSEQVEAALERCGRVRYDVLDNHYSWVVTVRMARHTR